MRPNLGIEGLLADAAPLLGPVELVDDLSFSRRAAVARLRTGDGRSVIAKLPFEVDALARELEALRTFPGSVRPALVASSDTLLVIEDLGTGPSLADLLLGDDATAAEAALLAWAETLGRALRHTLRHGADDDSEPLAEGLEELGRLAGELGVTVPRAVEDDAAHLSAALAEPGPWLAFCPGDTCPDNNRVLDDGSVRLFDFEGAGWRHAALEAAYCRAPFCTCWCVARMPEGMTQRMEDRLLAALSPPDPRGFRDVVALAAVRYTLVLFGWYRRFVVEDRPVLTGGRAPSTGRQYVYERLRTVAGQAERLPALAAVAGDLADHIREQWPDAASMPLYPAFRTAPR